MTPCMEWAGARTPKGYGQTYVRGRRAPQRAHRVAWEAARGPIPAGLFVLHACDNPPCVNVDHLYLGTAADNARDRGTRGRTASGERHGSARLTEVGVGGIRSLLEQGGKTHRQIAEAFGVSRGTVTEIANARRWKGV